ncbi:Superoxide dismutase [Ascochyta rabiei]|uniref:Superoxide dismutase n=1 Tax=Didymella rabiei TaxID=5454 RepID=UPI001900A44A|nr:Superoxide dismutase [Ascochyta rabiei]UPX14959.1 Superoxide dismutase [Ascochyta rabiei]
MHNFILAAGFAALVSAQSQVVEAPPPPPVLLSTTKSGVLPIIPSATGTPFAGVDTLQGAIISPLPPNPSYTGVLGPAPSQTNQPAATYVATLPDSMFNPLVGDAVQGTISAVGSSSGVEFIVNITNLPDQAAYGPFNWHIHTLPVPADGNCTATTGHLDPQNIGELYMCNPAAPATCQVGDLAGKHGGKISTPGSFSTSFVDHFLSTEQGSPAFFGGLAFVLHTRNTSRITCANFQMHGGAGNATAGNGTIGGNATATSSGGLPEYTGAAGRLTVGAAAVVAGFAVALL